MSSATHDIPLRALGALGAGFAGLLQIVCGIPRADPAVAPIAREQQPVVAASRGHAAQPELPALALDPPQSEAPRKPAPLDAARLARERGPGNPVSALFPYTRTEALATVELREDHPNPGCRSPLALLRTLRGDLQGFALEDGTCVATLAMPAQDTGASLQFRCPVRRTGRLCTEYFQGFVWLTLEAEASLRPYSATYSLEGVSRGYLRCQPAPELPNIAVDESTRKLPADAPGLKQLDGSLFTARTADCPPGA
jgi:hypothetical protein